MARNARELRNLVERITILSSNETKQKINNVINDVLDPSSKKESNKDILEKSFQSPLKEAREQFEKNTWPNSLKYTMGIFQKLQISLAWKDQRYTESSNY